MGTLEGCCTQVSAGLEWRERGFRVRACRGPKSGRGTEGAEQSEERAGDWKERWPKDQNPGGDIRGRSSRRFHCICSICWCEAGNGVPEGLEWGWVLPDKMLPPPEPKKTVAPVDN